jgi:hypothetical protein
MQTLAFLWYELEAAKRHVEEAFTERQSGKADSSFLNNASESHVIDERAQRPVASVVALDSKERSQGKEPTIFAGAVLGVLPQYGQRLLL